MKLLVSVLYSRWRAAEFPKYPRISKANFKSWNNIMFKKYNNERVYNHVNPLIRYVERKRVQAVIELLNPIKKLDYILAAGCGEGYIERRLPDARLAMVDLSPEAIKRAKKNLAYRTNIEFYLQDLENLSFQDSSFDKIECSEVIEHVFSPGSLMQELKRVLKKEGFLVISFPNEPLINLAKRFFIRLKVFNIFFPNISKDMTTEWHLRSFDLNRFKEIIGDEWNVIIVKGIPWSFFPLRYVVKCSK